MRPSGFGLFASMPANEPCASHLVGEGLPAVTQKHYDASRAATLQTSVAGSEGANGLANFDCSSWVVNAIKELKEERWPRVGLPLCPAISGEEAARSRRKPCTQSETPSCSQSRSARSSIVQTATRCWILRVMGDNVTFGQVYQIAIIKYHAEYAIDVYVPGPCDRTMVWITVC